MTFLNQINSRKKYICIFILVAVIIAAAFLAYRSKQEKVVTLGVFVGSPWGVPDPYTYEFIDDAIEKFESENPGVTVKYVSGIQKDDYSEWLAGNILRGTAPDVFMVLPEDFSYLEKIGALNNLDSLIEGDESFDSSRYYSNAYNYGNVDNSQYALPLESAPDMMFVNKSLLAKEAIIMPDPDWTWDEFYEICERVTKDTDGNGMIDQFGVYNYTWIDAFITNDTNPFSEDGKSCNLQGEKSVEAVEFLMKLHKLNNSSVATAGDFDMGKVAFMPLSLAEYRAYKPYPWSIKKYSDFDWDCITLPRGPQGANVSKMNTLLMGMNSRTKNAKLSWKLMKSFCYDEDIQLEVYKYREGGAVLRGILEKKNALLIMNQVLSKDDTMNIRIIHEIMSNAYADYNFSGANEAKDIITSGIDDIVNNKKNPAISLKNLQREVNQFLSR